jgi:hypothetical protein
MASMTQPMINYTNQAIAATKSQKIIQEKNLTEIDKALGKYGFGSSDYSG